MTHIDELYSLPRFVTFRQAAEYLGVSRSTVARMVAAGDLEAWRLESGRRKIVRDSLARLVGIKPESPE